MLALGILLAGSVLVTADSFTGYAHVMSDRLPTQHRVRRSNMATYFTPRNDACTGKSSSSHALIAALSVDMYGDADAVSPYCGRCVQVIGPNGSVHVRIVDACPTCERRSLDLTQSAFRRIAPLHRGVVPIRWTWVACHI